MRIGVISDTHVRSFSDVPDSVKTKLSETDLVVHAGDFTEKSVLKGLKELGELRAVCGNMDSPELKQTLSSKDIFEVNGKRIGLTHGWGAPWGIAEKVRQVFKDVDIIIYGHSHVAFSEVIQGCLMFNPGLARESFGLLTIEEEVKSEIIKV